MSNVDFDKWFRQNCQSYPKYFNKAFYEKIGFEKYASDPEILVKMYQNLTRQTKPSNFDTFWPISRDRKHIFQNRFLRWNREIKPVVLSIMKPINKKTFFSPYKGAGGSLGGARGRSSRPRRELKFYGESYITMFNGKISCASSESNFAYFWPPLLPIPTTLK